MPTVTRKQFLAAGTAAAAAPFARSALGQSGPRSGGRPKNVLFLMTDQHKSDCLTVEGDALARTPNLDGFSRTAVRFSNAYCTNPVCTPSRASFLTGLHTHNNQTWNNSTPWPFRHKTMAHAFTRAGYMSGLIGKMHFVDGQTHGFDYRLDFNDWWQQLGPMTKLYAEELGRRNSGSGMPQIDDLWRDFDDPWKGVRELDDRKGMVHTGRASKIPEDHHFENFVARESIRFLKNHGREQPFFLVSSLLKPHDPFMPGKRFAEMFRPEDMKLPDTWGKVDLNKIPRRVRNSIEHNNPCPELQDPATARFHMAMYYANLAHADDALGQVLRALHDLDLEKDTIVIYTSDHGEMLGEHGLWQKFQFYDASCRVPLMFRVPGTTEAGARCDVPVSLVELMPTLCELCGLTPPQEPDGESLMGLIRQPQLKKNTKVYAEYDLETPNAKYMMRSGDYKYSFWVNDTPELYNMRDDPKEMRNLAILPDYKGRMEDMRAQLFDWHRPAEMKV
jgi:choline-sulfatase